MSNFDRYKTRDKVNQGEMIELADVDTGEKTGDWIQVESQWSDHYQQAVSAAQQAGADQSMGLSDDEAEAVRGRYLAAAFVSGWSNDIDCTLDNVAGFLYDKPEMMAEILKIGTNDTYFFRKPSIASTDGPDPK